MTIILWTSFLIATTAFVYAVVLQFPGEALSWLNQLTARLPDPVRKPLFSCQKCVAGQLSLWLFPFWICPRFGMKYDPVLHIFSISLSIFFAVLITIFFDRISGPGQMKPRIKVKVPEELL